MKITRLDENNALLLLLRWSLLQSWEPMSRSLGEETYVIIVCVHLLSDLPNCRFLSILIAVYFLGDIPKAGLVGPQQY